jgi:hypothetical protein
LIQDLPVLRALFIVLEVALRFAFWAVMKKKGGDFYVFGILPLCSWNAEDLEYTGLCSHNLLEEQIGTTDFSLSPQDRGFEGIEKAQNKPHGEECAKPAGFHCHCEQDISL